MLSKGFFESIYRESNRLDEGCGVYFRCGSSETPDKQERRKNINRVKNAFYKIPKDNPDYDLYERAKDYFYFRPEAIKDNLTGKENLDNWVNERNSSMKENLSVFNECGAGGVTISYSSCGGSRYSSSTQSCEVGRRVRIAVGSGCGASVEVGRLLGYAD